MKEVSTNGTRLLLSAMDRFGVAVGPMLEGLATTERQLRTPGQHIDWEVWAELMDRLESALGGPEALEEFACRGSSSSTSLHHFQRVAQLVSSPRALYRLNARWGVPNQYRHMESRCEDLDHDRLRVRLSMSESYRGSTAAFRAAAGVLRGIPRIIGLPAAKVLSQELSPHQLTVILAPPRSRSLLSRARSLTRRVQGLESMLEQLGDQELELKDKHARLERQLLGQKRVEAALRISEERWRALAENAPGIILLLSGDGQITSVSRTFADAEPSALIGNRLAEMIEGSERVNLESAIAEVKTALAVRDIQFHVVDAERGEIWYACRLGPLSQGPGDVAISAFLTDITERLRAEQDLRHRELELQRTQKLEAVGRLAGGVAHDFNNLLTVIRGGADLMLGHAEITEQQREELGQIRHAGERAVGLTRQLLAFSRQQVILREVLELGQVVEDAKRMLERLIGEDIQLEVEAAAEAASVKLDRGQVEQILMNLAINARDAMPRGGTLTIATQNVEIAPGSTFGGAGIEPGSYVQLAVRDSGLGMDTRVIERIFEPFYSTKQEGKGTGLGLAIVRSIANQSGGYVAVESELGCGTVFRLLFPRCYETPSAARRADTRAADGGSETILLVEDDPQVRRLAGRILTGRGYRVLACADAAEALGRAKTEVIDLLLADVVMPEISGPELSRLLTESRPEIAVLFMSGYAEDEIVQRGVVTPAISLLQKPFDPESLARSVRDKLDERHLKRLESG